MLKVALRSKYIRIFVAVLAVAMVASFLLAESLGTILKDYAEDALERPMINMSEGTNKYLTYKQEHVSGKYTLKGNDSGWRIEDNNKKVIYETDSPKACLTNKEGYLWETASDAKTSIVNIKTGKAEWTGEVNESVVTDDAGFWVIKVALDNKEFFSKSYYYLLDDNFEVALDGLRFDRIGNDTRHGYVDNYIYGKLKDSKEACVINGDGEIVYRKQGADIDFIIDDIAWVTYDDDPEEYHISLAGPTKGQVVEVEWDE